MCGIAVAVGVDDAEGLVARLLGGIAHRGDITDPVVSPIARTAMGTRRLRIVDADHAIQPQASFDGGLLVALNGEIYNHVELRHELSGLGVRFRTASDTEVLANALRVWGADALERLNGMYAFVAIEVASGEFLAARDPFGVKPLYLLRVDEGYLFCSEIRPLLETVDTGDVLLIPPGHLLMRRALKAFSPTVLTPGFDDGGKGPQALDRLLGAAVERRIPPELPFATFFSGGIDSTLVAHYARRYRPEAPGYFLGGPNAPDYAFAARYADVTGYDLRVVPLDAGDVCDERLIGEVIAAVESFEPETVRVGLCSYLLARRMHEDGFRVALCGEGADELFAGYIPLERAFLASQDLGSDVQRQCLDGMHRSNLQRVDRCSMRFQIETREPFLDPTVARYALNLAAADLVRSVDGKAMGKTPLREVFDLYPAELPSEIKTRLKSPFNEGAGMDASQTDSPLTAFVEDKITDARLSDGARQFADYGIKSKEELFYMEKLNTIMDIDRVPHLKGRSHILLPKEFSEGQFPEFRSVSGF